MASVFKVLQSCDARWFSRKFYVTDHSSIVMSSCHKYLAVFGTSSQRSKQHLKDCAARIGLHNCITFKNKSLTNSDKVIHIVNLRHKTSKKVHFCDDCRKMDHFLFGVERAKRFVNVHLHCIVICQQPKKNMQDVDVVPPGKNSADAHGKGACGHHNENLPITASHAILLNEVSAS